MSRLIRAVEKDDGKRSAAALQALRHTGIRVGGLSDLRLSNIRIADRKRFRAKDRLAWEAHKAGCWPVRQMRSASLHHHGLLTFGLSGTPVRC